ncbi:hypothetical protein ACNI3K_06045 [Demequina sp. SO4-13]|uniref:hypothetical protein n=1 Tax=Demequina sp. SO4-13 TaxID=3401027 RepID=UPI003AF90B87
MIKNPANANASTDAMGVDSEAAAATAKRAALSARKIAQERRDRVLATCPSCYTNLPATGECGYCA